MFQKLRDKMLFPSYADAYNIQFCRESDSLILIPILRIDQKYRKNCVSKNNHSKI